MGYIEPHSLKQLILVCPESCILLTVLLLAQSNIVEDLETLRMLSKVIDIQNPPLCCLNLVQILCLTFVCVFLNIFRLFLM